MDTEILIGYEFTDADKKNLKIANSDELNGWYNYLTKIATINVSSEDSLKKTNFNSFVRHFKKIVAHETIHGVIHDITGRTFANNTEEKFVELMTGDRRWSK